MDESGRRAILITGSYGSGKSTVAAEIASILERAGRPFALLDLDYLSWANPPGVDVHDDPALLLKNLGAVVRNYRRAGITEFIVAGYVDADDLVQAISATLGGPMHVVRLDVPWTEVERRLQGDTTTARAEDLREAERQIARASELSVDFIVQNGGDIAVTANEIMQLTGWHGSDTSAGGSGTRP